MTAWRKERGEIEVDGRWEVVSAVAKSEDCLGKSNEVGTCMKESLMREESLQLQRCNNDAQKVDGQIITPSFITSLNGTQRDRPGICLEVNLGHDHFISQLNGPGFCRTDLQGDRQANESIRRIGQRGTGPSKGNKKNVVVRAAAKVLSRSFSGKSKSICDAGRLKEA
ncbi:hypothetical protein LOK49_LG03G03330 [Camellia lanceoleosa]|uniref:Uncharacterized protein n=1 Tax=Camellia lanceoleosa TaxID=1840588 RepID=A0ACC0IAC4_9ERIC|nr:hypothetical protein LOK49_LG03G03330 [Camellia lanceoleosa]